MALENKWVTYLHRSYKSIKASILSKMQTEVPEITDHSESNIFVIIINVFAGLIEQINYYIDDLARESFISTARRYSSLIKLTRLIDYRVKSKVASFVDLKITAVDINGDPVLLENNETISAGYIVKNSAGTEFITQTDVTIFKNTSSIIIGARQQTKVTSANLGQTSNLPNQIFELPPDYQDGTLQIEIDLVSWELRDTFAFSGPLDKHFIVEVDQNKQAWIVFGDNIHGAIPPNGQTVYGTFYNCKGKWGNVEANTINTWVSAPTPPVQVPTIDHYEVTNELLAVGGVDEEGIEEIRKHAVLSLKTLNRAVTLQDHKDLALLVPGVGKAIAEFNTSLKKIIFYIAPTGGGTAPSQLLTDVENYFQDKKMISTTVEAFAAGETSLRLAITATVKFRRNVSQATADIKEVLQNAFGFNNSDINKQIRRSDIIALIDNLDKIDYLKLDVLSIKPYPRIFNGINPLENNWYAHITPESIEITSWRLVVVSSSIARLFRKGPSGGEVLDGEVTIHASYVGYLDYTSSDLSLDMTMWGLFNVADEWRFKTYPYNQDIAIEDNTIPIYNEAETILVVNEQRV